MKRSFALFHARNKNWLYISMGHPNSCRPIPSHGTLGWYGHLGVSHRGKISNASMDIQWQSRTRVAHIHTCPHFQSYTCMHQVWSLLQTDVLGTKTWDVVCHLFSQCWPVFQGRGHVIPEDSVYILSHPMETLSTSKEACNMITLNADPHASADSVRCIP